MFLKLNMKVINSNKCRVEMAKSYHKLLDDAILYGISKKLVYYFRKIYHIGRLMTMKVVLVQEKITRLIELIEFNKRLINAKY